MLVYVRYHSKFISNTVEKMQNARIEYWLQNIPTVYTEWSTSCKVDFNRTMKQFKLSKTNFKRES